MLRDDLIRRAIADPVCCARFQSRVKKSGRCWEWAGRRSNTGYGLFTLCMTCTGGRDKFVRAHRMAWSIEHKQTPPNGMFVCHKCDNPSCVRPSHLFVGTPADNNRDMDRKGRHACGEQQPRAVFTPDIVRAIRGPLRDCSRTRFAAYFGVSPSAIRDVLSRRRWNHVK